MNFTNCIHCGARLDFHYLISLQDIETVSNQLIEEAIRNKRSFETVHECKETRFFEHHLFSLGEWSYSHTDIIYNTTKCALQVFPMRNLTQIWINNNLIISIPSIFEWNDLESANEVVNKIYKLQIFI